MYKPRASKNEMTFDMADRAESRKLKGNLAFFSKAQTLLEEKGETDAAFYMEMIKDHLREGGKLESEKAARILGL
jgi:hypothetical protein